MLFDYDELKECVEEDFERFYNMGFNEKQIFPAIVNEYEHGEDFCSVENICIYVFSALKYAEKGLDWRDIQEKLVKLIKEEGEDKIRIELGNKHTKFIIDLQKIS